MSNCKYCNKEFEKKSIGGHTRNCELNPNRNNNWANTKKINIRVGTFIYENNVLQYSQNPKRCLKCLNILSYIKRNNKFCSTNCSTSYNNLVRGPRSAESRLKMSISNKNSEKARISNLLRIKQKAEKSCPICNNKFYVRPSELNKIYCSKNCYKDDNKCEFRSKAGGGFRLKSGYGKSGWYKEYWCSSSYELAWIIYNIDHGIYFERNKLGFNYEYEGIKHKYYPDFILQDGSFVEIKGYNKNGIVDIKSKAVDNLRVLYKKDLKFVFDYVISIYGTDFIKLYEGNPYIKLNSKCKYCGAACKTKNIYCSQSCSMKGNKYKKEKIIN